MLAGFAPLVVQAQAANDQWQWAVLTDLACADIGGSKNDTREPLRS